MNFRVADSDRRLTESGRRQARATATAISKQLVHGQGDNVQLIYGSLQRTVETAREFMEVMP